MSRKGYKTHSHLPSSGGYRPSQRSIMSGASNKTFNFPSTKKAKSYKISEKEGIKVAERMFDHYDRDMTGDLNDEQIAIMLRDAYRGIRKNYYPTSDDIESYKKIMDRNGDGRVTTEDIEATVMKFFCVDDEECGYLGSRRDITSNRYI